MLVPDPIHVRRVDHVVLRTRQLEAMVAFYRDVLGCQLERGPGSHGLAQLRAGASLVDILQVADSKHSATRSERNMDHLCLLVTPWDEPSIRAHLQRHRVTVGTTVPRYGALGVGPSIYLEDPDGNTVELKGPST